MKLFFWFLFILSACIYASSFIFSAYCWWMIFLFPIPLFYITAQERIGFKAGAIWGLVGIMPSLLGVLMGIDSYTSSSDGIARAIPSIALLFYVLILFGSFFLLTTHIQYFLNLNAPLTIIVCWMLSLWSITFFLDRMCLLPFGRCEGYFGLQPLLPLACYPPLLHLLPILGKNILTLLFYFVPGSTALFLLQPTIRSATLIILCLMPWSLSLLLPQREGRPTWLHAIATLPASIPKMSDSINQAHIMKSYLQKLIQQFPETKVVILPESAFRCDHLGTNPSLCALWSKAHIGKPIHIVVGAFKWEGAKFYNSLHWIYDGQIQNIFDKRHAMVFLETIPRAFNFSWINQLFFKQFNQIEASSAPRKILNLANLGNCIPYICSELFMNEYPDDAYSHIPILAITNDLWCIHSYVADLMHLAARFKAIQWQRGIMYVSFKHSVFFDQYGNESRLNRL